MKNLFCKYLQLIENEIDINQINGISLQDVVRKVFKIDENCVLITCSLYKSFWG